MISRLLRGNSRKTPFTQYPVNPVQRSLGRAVFQYSFNTKTGLSGSADGVLCRSNSEEPQEFLKSTKLLSKIIIIMFMNSSVLTSVSGL